MNTLEHKYFGKLSFDNANEIGIVWKGEVDGIDVTMWYDEDVEVMKGELDRFALF